MEALSKHFNPIPSVVVERFKFHSRVRKVGESIATYVAELRSLSEYCDFGTTLEDMLRDRLVCGVNDRNIQRTLLTQDLTYAKAVELAVSAETAVKSIRDLGIKPPVSGAQDPLGVHKTSTQKITCYHCGAQGHISSKCKVDKDIVCHQCHKRGYMKQVCRSTKGKHGGPVKTKSKTKTVRRVQNEEEEEQEDEDDSFIAVNKLDTPSPPIMIKVKLDDCLVDMEVDTGASISLMSERTFNKMWPGRTLQPSTLKLRTYLKETIPVVGCTTVNVNYNGQFCKLPLVVVAGSGPSLVGRDWLCHIRLDWRQINRVYNASLQAVLTRYPLVFQTGLGTLKGFEARIYVDPDAPPRFNHSCFVPFALRDKVKKELERLQAEGTIEPVGFAEWAAPIVAVLKRDENTVRICGDFSVTVNPVSKLDRYRIPKVEDLFARLCKGKHFSKLDLSQAYQQLPLEEDSKKYVVINTHWGLFQYTRLPFGISSAPGIFQRVIESILQV